MSSYQITLPSTPIHISHSSTSDSLVILLRGGRYQVWDLKTRLKKLKAPKWVDAAGKPALRKEDTVQSWTEEMEGRQVAVDTEGKVAVLGRLGTRDVVLPTHSPSEAKTFGVLGIGWDGGMMAQTDDGTLIMQGEVTNASAAASKTLIA